MKTIKYIIPIIFLILSCREQELNEKITEYAWILENSSIQNKEVNVYDEYISNSIGFQIEDDTVKLVSFPVRFIAFEDSLNKDLYFDDGRWEFIEKDDGYYLLKLSGAYDDIFNAVFECKFSSIVNEWDVRVDILELKSEDIYMYFSGAASGRMP